jgi:enoyl-CoA hydratase/carnithine racemase
MRTADELLIGFADWPPPTDLTPPLALIDLGRWPADAGLGALPPYPVVGVGDLAHPIATSLDAVIEPPITVETLVRSVSQAPKAAATLVQLLRISEGLGIEQALPLESFAYGLLQGSSEHGAWLESRPRETPAPAGRVLVERQDNFLCMMLDRPAARNAIDREMRDQLFEAFTVAALDPEVRSVNLRATGAAFSIGGDLAEFGTTRDPAEAHQIRSRTLPALPLSACASKTEVHVQGPCIGAGIELAAFAARVTASSSAWFQLPELGMGLIPGAGGCVSLPRRIGRQRAALMILSGKRIGTKTALEWGLIDAIVDDPSADEGGPDQIGA